MSSSSVRRVLPASAFTYAATLRVRHPTLDPAVLTETLRLDPAHCWTAGEPRRSQTGAPRGGQHRESYWSAPIPAEQLLGASDLPREIPLEIFLNYQLVQLGRHREFLHRLQGEGGEVSLLIELSPVANASLTLSTAVVRKLADLNIETEFQFVGD